MPDILHISLDSLLRAEGVESARLEFKAGWDEKTTGYQALRTICAFANDFYELSGGYVVIGVEERDTCAVLPPKGLSDFELEAAQKWLRGNCNNIDPDYQPVISPEEYQGKKILVIWAPASSTRPHKAPDAKGAAKKYWIRLGSETVDADKNGKLQELMSLSAKIPFDDRPSHLAGLLDLRESRIREFLSDINSELVDFHDVNTIYRKMRVSKQINSHEVPLNVGLLFFSDSPEKWFPGARIEICQFSDEVGDIQEEKTFKGPIHVQLRECIRYLENISSYHISKQETMITSKGWVGYPLPALREALVNAVYHRSYEDSEPTKVYLYPDRMEIISYPGPVPGIRKEHLVKVSSVPPVPSRNRRIGEFLKDLRLAEARGTGTVKIFKSMEQNGSPPPLFDFDEEARNYFRVILPAHPEYTAINTVRIASYLRASGDVLNAEEALRNAWEKNKSSVTITGELLELLASQGRISEVSSIYSSFSETADPAYLSIVRSKMINILISNNRKKEAESLISQMESSPFVSAGEVFEAAKASRRLGNEEKAHGLYLRAGDIILKDSGALLEFAQCKISLARKNWRMKKKEAAHKLNQESLVLLERVVQLDGPPIRQAFAWRDMARVKEYLKMPKSDVIAAYNRAIELQPDSAIFTDSLKQYLIKSQGLDESSV